MKTLAGLIVLGLLAVVSGGAGAAASPIDRFVGHWVGEGVTETDSPGLGVGLVDRELAVTVEPVGRGFRLTWETARPSRAGKRKTSTTSVLFVESRRKGLYRAADAGDPVSGAPLSWAHVEGDALVVQRVTISDAGVLEQHKYVRTLLAPGQMQLRFTRTIDGVSDRSVFSILFRR